MGCFRRAAAPNQGFTLIELIVVVAIIAFVSAAVMPSFSMALLKNRQREAAILITEAVFTARTRAAQTNHCQRVRITLDTPQAAGGTTGGVVKIYEYPTPDACTDAAVQALADWNLLSVRAVAQGVDPEVPFVPTGQVGNDVGIVGVVHRVGLLCPNTLDGNPVDMFFDPSGGLNVLINNNAIERYFIIRADSGAGTVGKDKMVRINSGGNISDANCP